MIKPYVTYTGVLYNVSETLKFFILIVKKDSVSLQLRCMKSYLFKISRICFSIPIILLVVVQFYPWFRFCLFSLCFKLLITHNQTLKQRKIINKMNILNLNKYEFQHLAFRTFGQKKKLNAHFFFNQKSISYIKKTLNLNQNSPCPYGKQLTSEF